MRIIISTLILFTIILNSSAQNKKIIGKITDLNDSAPIPFCHIIIKNHPEVGTISNEDGTFYLSSNSNIDTIIVSHLNYHSITIPVTSYKIQAKLELKTNSLNEVTATALKPETIMQQVTEHIEDNHEVEPVCYEFYTRVTRYTDQLETIEEHVGQLYHTPSHETKVNLNKTRIKPCSSNAKKEFVNYRLIAFGKIMTDNIFKYRKPFLKENQLDKYTFQLKGITELNGRSCYKLKYNRNSDSKYAYEKAGILLIDTETFGICKMQMFSSRESNPKSDKEVWFTFSNNKWYLNLVIDNHFNKEYNKRITQYIKTKLPTSLEDFRSCSHLMPEKLKEHIGSYTDEFWENYNFIPLPEHDLEQINNQ